MNRADLEREADALLKVLAHEARFGRPVHDRRSVSGATPIRKHEPAHNDLLRDAYPLKPAGELGAALAMLAVAAIFVIVLIEMAVK